MKAMRFIYNLSIFYANFCPYDAYSFNRNPLVFQSFLRNNIFNINDICVKNNKTFVDNQTMLNRLDDKTN